LKYISPALTETVVVAVRCALAAAASGHLAENATRSALGTIDRTYGDFSLIELTDLTGKVLASSRRGVSVGEPRRPLRRMTAMKPATSSTVIWSRRRRPK